MFTVRPLVSMLLVGLLGAFGAACSASVEETETAGSKLSDTDGGVTPAAGSKGAKCGTAQQLRCKDGLECSVRKGNAPGVCRPQTFGDEGEPCGGTALPVACTPGLFVCKRESPDDASGICTAPADGEEGGFCGGDISCSRGLVCHDDRDGGLGVGTCLRP